MTRTETTNDLLLTVCYEHTDAVDTGPAFYWKQMADGYYGSERNQFNAAIDDAINGRTGSAILAGNLVFVSRARR